MSKVYATVSTFVGHKGLSVWLGTGDEYEENDEIVKAHRGLFTATVSPQAAVVTDKARKRGTQ